MLALCLMISCTYYAKNYAAVIGLGLLQRLNLHEKWKLCSWSRIYVQFGNGTHMYIAMKSTVSQDYRKPY